MVILRVVCGYRIARTLDNPDIPHYDNSMKRKALDNFLQSCEETTKNQLESIIRTHPIRLFNEDQTDI